VLLPWVLRPSWLLKFYAFIMEGHWRLLFTWCPGTVKFAFLARSGAAFPQCAPGSGGFNTVIQGKKTPENRSFQGPLPGSQSAPKRRRRLGELID
jgi:hypothetical protein